jgi:hypothetical protein
VDYGIYVMDKDGNNTRLVYNDPDYNEIDPVVVSPRDLPQVIPTDPNVAQGLTSGSTTGMFFDGNVYDRAPNDGQTRPLSSFVNADGVTGQARYLRVLEAVPLPRNGNQRGGPIGNTNFEKQRVVGYAPVRADGSFSIEVPANRSLHLQTLDENGMMLVNQLTWIQVMPGERRLCTGCHDSHDRDRVINDLEVQPTREVINKALGRAYDSGFHNAFLVTAHSSARSDTVDFFDRLRPGRTNTVQSVLTGRCVSCHGGVTPAAGLRLELSASDLQPVPPNSGMSGQTSVYDTLTAVARFRTARNSFMDYVTESGARRSPLMWVMYNRQLNEAQGQDFRALSYDHSQLWTKDQFNRIDPFLPANRDLLTMIEWIDMGSQYSNTVGQ